jgi:hypothetical protein
VKYSSPQAYLNKYFKGRRKFNYILNEDAYEAKDWRLDWVESESFVLSRRVIDRDTGADYFDDIFKGTLIECVNYIKSESK